MKENNSLLSSPQLDDHEQLALALSPKQLHSLYRKSKSFGIPLDVLEAVYIRGFELAASNKEQAGFGRVNSFIHGGEAADLDSDLKEDDEKKHYAIATRTSKGWRRVKDTKFSTHERATAYGDKYHTDKHGAKFYKVVDHPGDKKKKLEETTQGEPQSSNPDEPSSRFVGSDSLTAIFKNNTPGQSAPAESKADVIRRVLKDRINNDKKDPT